MPSKQPVTPPTPRQVNRPLASPSARAAAKPITEQMMGMLRTVLDESETTRTQLGQEIGQPQQTISEWINGSRNSPGSEPTLKLLRWAFGKDRKSVLEFLKN